MHIRYEMRDGFAVAIKRAETPHDAEQLLKEHSLLSRLDVTGVAQLHSANLQVPELALHYVGRHTLGTFSSPRGWEWLFLLRRCSQLLERLHSYGIIHGAVTQSHILLNHRMQPVLCSFGRSVELDDAGVLAQGDVASLLRTARQVLSMLPSEYPAWAERLRGGRPRLLQELQKLLANLAETRQTTAANLTQRLSDLASSAGYSPSHSQDVYLREMQPAELVLLAPGDSQS